MSQVNRELKPNKNNSIDFYNKKLESDKYSMFLYSAIFLLITAAALAGYMIWHYNNYGQWTMDGVLQSFMADIRTTSLTAVFRGITITGESIPVIVATLIIMIILIVNKKLKEGLMLAIYMLGIWKLNEFLKELLHRPRIDVSQHLVDISGYNHSNQFSLPSGHAMNLMALVLLTLYFIWIFSNNKKLNLGLTLIILTFGLLVGVSRVYLNVHYFSDIVTGWSLAAAWASIAVIIHRLLCMKQNMSNN